MAGKREADPMYQPDEPGPTKSTGIDADNVDALVSGFLAELTDISSEMQKNGPAEGTQKFLTGRQVVVPRPPEPEEPAGSKPNPDLERISDEVESALAELERSRGKAVSIAGRREPSHEPSFAAAADKKLPVPPATRRKAVRPAVQASDRPEDNQWTELDILRNKVGSAGFVQRNRNILIALAAVLAAVIIGYFYFFRSNESAPPAPKPAALEQADAEIGEAVSPTQPPPPILSSKPEDTGSSLPSGASIQNPANARPRVKSAASPDAGSRISKPDPALPSQRNHSGAFVGGSSAAPVPEDQERTLIQTGDETALHAPVSRVSESASPVADPVSSANKVPIDSLTSASGETGTAPADRVPPEFSQEAARETPPQSTARASGATKTESAGAGERAVKAVPAEVLVRVPPAYPTMARTQNVTGEVKLVAYLNETGDVMRAEVVNGPTLLREAAEEALMKWRFRPASVNGRNVSSQVFVTMIFSMK